MKRLVCEICKGTNVVKDGGVFVCQNCGCKYSIEEVKNIITEVSSGSIQVVSSTKTDTDMLIKNYIELANSALLSKNYKEAEFYTNKVLEINVNHNLAWLIKGHLAAVTSTMDNLKFDEMVNCFAKAVMYTSNEFLDSTKKDVCETLETATRGLIRINCDIYKVSPSKENADFILKSMRISLKCSLDLFDKCGTFVVGLEIRNTAFVFNELLNMWEKNIIPKYNEKIKRSAMEGLNYINNVAIDYCYLMSKLANSMASSVQNEEASKLAVSIYESLIQLNKFIMSSADLAITEVKLRNYGYPQAIQKGVAVATSVRNFADTRIALYNCGLSDMKVKKVEAYYAAHPEEVQKMENDLVEIDSQIAVLNKQINTIVSKKSAKIRELKNKRAEILPIENQAKELDSEIKSLTSKMNTLGFFKAKERKALDEEISKKNEMYQKLNDEAVSLRESHNNEISSQIKQIETERDNELKPLKSNLSELEKRKKDIMVIKNHLDSKNGLK